MNPLSDSSDFFLPTPLFPSKPPFPSLSTPPPILPNLQSLLSNVSLGKDFKKEDFSLEKHGILLIDALIMKAFSNNNEEKMKILSQTQFLEAILNILYPVLAADTMKNI